METIVHLTEIKIKEMLQRFLVEKQMPKEHLVEVLGISIKNLEQIFSHKITPELISKIELPLVKLYCKTKWE